VVLVEVLFGDLGRVLGSEHFDFDHEMGLMSRSKYLAAEITRNV
jgi:hypothetical protein